MGRVEETFGPPRPLKRRLPTIRWVVAAVVVGPILVTAAVLLALSVVTARHAAESLVGTVMDSVAVDVGEEVRDHMTGAVRLSEVYERRFRDGSFSIKDPRAWGKTITEDLAGSPGVAAVVIAQATGEAVWVRKHNGRLEFGTVKAGSTTGYEYVIDESGKIAEPYFEERPYVATKRPWYVEAERSTKPVWTQIYPWLEDGNSDGTVGIGFARADRDAQGQMRGAYVVNVSLENLNVFLRSRPIADVGAIFIVDGEGKLVATSAGSVGVKGTSRAAFERPNVQEFANPLAAAAARALKSSGAGAGKMGASAREIVNGEPVRVRVVAVDPKAGVDWRIAIVLPESAFLADVAAGYRRGVLLALAATCVGAAIAAVLGRRLSRPIAALSTHLVRIGDGHFEEKLTLGAAQEFSDAADRVNEMAESVRKRMDLERALGVATEVQQALLPSDGVALAGLDVAGHAAYCDETGGDYYDFLSSNQGSDEGPGTTNLVIGDVSGHGIGAALLMATARAALRAYAAQGDAPEVILTKVNALLFESVRPGNFMTMSVLQVDAPAGLVVWASAGHDPAMVCEPGAKSVEELDGADPPLAIMGDTEYRAFRRENLKPGTLIFSGTDGVWEMKNETGELFGKDRLKEFLLAHASLGAAEIGKKLDLLLHEYRGVVPLADDVTFWILKLPGL